ncbi:MBL fold metallo-hydrolase, partial [Streptomyces sp. NPDC055722]
RLTPRQPTTATVTGRHHTPESTTQRAPAECLQRETGLITGDLIHHPCQLARPEWSASVDFEKEASTATRRRVLSELADTPALLIGTHFPSPSAGLVVRDGDAFRLQY